MVHDENVAAGADLVFTEAQPGFFFKGGDHTSREGTGGSRSLAAPRADFLKLRYFKHFDKMLHSLNFYIVLAPHKILRKNKITGADMKLMQYVPLLRTLLTKNITWNMVQVN